jgi:hypothetical protein
MPGARAIRTRGVESVVPKTLSPSLSALGPVLLVGWVVMLAGFILSIR